MINILRSIVQNALNSKDTKNVTLWRISLLRLLNLISIEKNSIDKWELQKRAFSTRAQDEIKLKVFTIHIEITPDQIIRLLLKVNLFVYFACWIWMA